MRLGRQICSMCVFCLLLSPIAHAELFKSWANPATPPNSHQNKPRSLAPMLQKIMPSIVNISVIGEMANTNAGEDGYPLGMPKPFKAVGSGVIIDAKNGYVVTNAHVIADAKMISVILGDGRHLRAKRIGSDAASDIAILQVKNDNITAIPLANTDNLQVGDFVTAIGNPFGLHHSVTSGVVSALHRNDLHIEGYEDFIQTDAPINPGNSGGALVDLDGRLVGINTALFGPAGNHGNVGIGFAIPTNMMMNIASQLIQVGKVRRGLIGVMVQKLTPALANAFNLKAEQGAIVTQVRSGSPADRAGLKAKDLILQVNGKIIDGASELRNITGLTPIGTKIMVKIMRGKTISEKKLIITSREDMVQQMKEKSLLAGVQLRSVDGLSPTGEQIHGVIVGSVDYTSNAWLAGLRPGDIIVSVDGSNIRSIQDILKTTEHRKHLLFEIYRGQGVFFVAVESD